MPQFCTSFTSTGKDGGERTLHQSLTQEITRLVLRSRCRQDCCRCSRYETALRFARTHRSPSPTCLVSRSDHIVGAGCFKFPAPPWCDMCSLVPYSTSAHIPAYYIGEQDTELANYNRRPEIIRPPFAIASICQPRRYTSASVGNRVDSHTSIRPPTGFLTSGPFMIGRATIKAFNAASIATELGLTLDISNHLAVLQ